MKTFLLSTVAMAALATIPAFQFASAAEVKPLNMETLDKIALQATSAGSAKSATAIERLRAAGPSGLDAMFHVYNERIERQQFGVPAKDPSWEQLRTALDTIGQQRDCYASHLYWYTDLEKAEAAARASGKPILSLRLLGKLNEEYSCANSRFFRTTLYPNTQVAQYLRTHFILHWQSVRPVPRITIDMGDGRRIERTITGNSIHYVLDANGNPIDALPGLYGAKTFLTELERAAAAEEQASKLNGAERETFLRRYHSTRVAQIQRQWSIDLATLTPTPGARAFPVAADFLGTPFGRTPDAIDAAPLAGSKSGVERPMLRSGAETVLSLDQSRLNLTDADSVWPKIAALHTDEGTLDSSSIKLIQFKQPPTATEAARAAYSKSIVETPMVRMLRNLQRSIAEDTVRNEYQLHQRIHEWFSDGTAPSNLDALNSKIYAELFLTPNSDAWLGLAPADTFSALDGGGLVQTTTP